MQLTNAMVQLYKSSVLIFFILFHICGYSHHEDPQISINEVKTELAQLIEKLKQDKGTVDLAKNLGLYLKIFELGEGDFAPHSTGIAYSPFEGPSLISDKTPVFLFDFLAYVSGDREFNIELNRRGLIGMDERLRNSPDYEFLRKRGLNKAKFFWGILGANSPSTFLPVNQIFQNRVIEQPDLLPNNQLDQIFMDLRSRLLTSAKTHRIMGPTTGLFVLKPPEQLNTEFNTIYQMFLEAVLVEVVVRLNYQKKLSDFIGEELNNKVNKLVTMIYHRFYAVTTSATQLYPFQIFQYPQTAKNKPLKCTYVLSKGQNIHPFHQTVQ